MARSEQKLTHCRPPRLEIVLRPDDLQRDQVVDQSGDMSGELGQRYGRVSNVVRVFVFVAATQPPGFATELTLKLSSGISTGMVLLSWWVVRFVVGRGFVYRAVNRTSKTFMLVWDGAPA